MVAVAVAALVVAFSPAAIAADCSVGAISWVGSTPALERLEEDPDLDYAILGSFLAVDADVTTTIEFNGRVVAVADPGQMVSVGVPSDATSVRICPVSGVIDVPPALGQLTPAVGGDEAEREPDESQLIVDADAETWEDHQRRVDSAFVYPL